MADKPIWPGQEDPRTVSEEKLARLKQLRALQEKALLAEAGETHRRPWREIARPEQLAPDGDWFVWLLLAGRGFGKELVKTTLIPTPDGWVKLGDVVIGDTVFDEAGLPCRVTAVFDRTPDVAYRVAFSDGTHLDAGADHQWVTWTNAERKSLLRSPYEDHSRFPDNWPQWRSRRVTEHYYLSRDVVGKALSLRQSGLSARAIGRELGVSRQALARHLAAGRYVERVPKTQETSLGPRVRTTGEIASTLTTGARGDRNHCIPVCGELQLPEASLPVDPYVLGFWLGDGHTAAGYVTTADEDVLREFEARRFTVQELKSSRRGACASYSVRSEKGSTLSSILRAAHVLGAKHVPQVYLRASARQRLELLQGLMDSDGYADSGSGAVEFCSTNRDIAMSLAELATSLGQKPVISEDRARISGRDCGARWRVTWRPTVAVFRLKRKLERVRDPGAQSLRNHHRMIVSAERIEPSPMRCLTVDSPNSMYLAGEGMIPTHNTKAAAEWCVEKARKYPGMRVALVASTIADVRDTLIEGDSGILNALQRHELRGGSQDKAWNRSLVELFMANGTRFKGYSSEKPWKLRGPQFHIAWGDEAAFWADAARGTIADTTWTNLNIATRLPARPEWPEDFQSQIVVATTPRPVALLKATDPDPARAGLMQRDNVVVTKGRTADNLSNLSESYKANVIAPLLGTRLGRQELDAEILDDREDALWRRDWIDETRMAPSPLPEFSRVVVAVDPAVSDGEGSAETGIIVAGADRRGHGYVIADYTMRGTPDKAMRKVVQAYHDHQADRVVGEVNNGGDYIGTLLRAVDPGVPYRAVRASRGKATRAEPVSALYEQRRVHHLGTFPYLEDQMCFAAGTLVETRRGAVPIELVRRGDFVLTRDGWFPVAWSGQSGVRPTVTVRTTQGTLECTADHPVFTQRAGFTPAGSLRAGDRLLTCHDASCAPSSSTGERSTSKKATTGAPPGPWEPSFCIASSGRRSTGSSSPLAGSSTTRTTIRPITAPTIWPQCPGLSTSVGTSTALPQECSHSARRSAQLMPRTTGSQRTPRPGSAGCVDRSSGPEQHSLCTAPGAAVISVSAAGTPQPVYDISVSGPHEFFAGGILVHNCSWAPGDEQSPDRLDACMAEGTPVRVMRGEVPIESVELGDLAWTHAGWREVSGVRCTRRDASVGVVRLSNGKELRGTADHPIWVRGGGWTRLDALAAGAMLSGWDFGSERETPKAAAIHVEHVWGTPGRADVYDLMVEDVHEFTASGVIVHNCVWAFFDLKDLVTGSWADAYGVVKCESEKCGRPFLKTVNGKTRDACPFCGYAMDLGEAV